MRCIGSVGIVLLCSLMFSGSAQAEEALTQRTQALLEAFRAVHSNDGAALSAAQREENELSFARLDGFFDLAAFAEACIAPSKAEFSPEALERFLNSFQALVRDVAYPDSGAFLRRASVKVGVPAARDGRVFVPVAMLLPDEELELEVSFCWEGEGASARVVDVLFDGDSLVLEYMNQFGAIIDREGVAGLQRKLDAKAEELANKRAEP